MRRPCETRNLLGPRGRDGRGFGHGGGAWAGTRAQACAKGRPRAAGPGWGGEGEGRSRAGGARARGRGLGARAQARAGRRPRARGVRTLAAAGGAPRGRRGAGGGAPSAARRAGPGAAGREGEASSASAPAPWRRTTATVSAARPGGHALPCFLSSRVGRPAAPRVSREQWCGTRARGAGPGGGLRRAGAAGRLRAEGRPGLRSRSRRSQGWGRRGRGVWVARAGTGSLRGGGRRAEVSGRCHPTQAWRCPPRTLRLPCAAVCILCSFRPFLVFASCVPRCMPLSETKGRKQQTTPKWTGFTWGGFCGHVPRDEGAVGGHWSPGTSRLIVADLVTFLGS